MPLRAPGSARVPPQPFPGAESSFSGTLFPQEQDEPGRLQPRRGSPRRRGCAGGRQVDVAGEAGGARAGFCAGSRRDGAARLRSAQAARSRRLCCPRAVRLSARGCLVTLKRGRNLHCANCPRKPSQRTLRLGRQPAAAASPLLNTAQSAPARVPVCPSRGTARTVGLTSLLAFHSTTGLSRTAKTRSPTCCSWVTPWCSCCSSTRYGRRAGGGQSRRAGSLIQ